MRRTIIAIATVLLLAGCGGKSANDGGADMTVLRNPNSAEGYDERAKMPAITFDSDMHDFGRLSAGETIKYSFKFTNTGNADLIISGCDASCGCTIADYPRGHIAPGESGYVTVSFQSSGMSGKQMKEVTVVSNAQPARYKLRIVAEVF